MSKDKKVITIGMDTGLASSGFCVFDNEVLWGTINILHERNNKKLSPGGKFSAVWDKQPGGCGVLTMIYPYLDSSPLGVDLHQIIGYSNIVSRVMSVVSTEFGLTGSASSPDVHIAIELPMGGHMGSGAKVDRMFTAAFLALREQSRNAVGENPWFFRCYRPSQIKKFITGKGNAKKDVIVKEVWKRFGFDTDITDIADAYATAKLLQKELIDEKR